MLIDTVLLRSIPACAGEPAWENKRQYKFEVYPRVCGGTLWFSTYQASISGLSPRVRGNHGHSTHRGRPSGSIPACAGEPAQCHKPACEYRVYPRVCGGTTRARAFCDGGRGLSPRVRGNP